jgi:thiol:disulfide interchange protein DsbA
MRKVLLIVILILFFANNSHGQETIKDPDVIQIPYQDTFIGFKKLDDSEFIFKEKENIKTEIIYFFSYGCPYCKLFDESLKVWLKNKKNDRSFRIIPVTFRDDWMELAKAYAIAKESNILKETHANLFKYIHEEKNKIITKTDLIEFFATRTNIKKDDFNSTYDSKKLKQNLKDYSYFQDFYDIQGTPNLLIIGKNRKVYKISPEYSGSPMSMILTAEFLIEFIEKDIEKNISLIK